jgi:hypothetical protein
MLGLAGLKVEGRVRVFNWGQVKTVICFLKVEGRVRVFEDKVEVLHL